MIINYPSNLLYLIKYNKANFIPKKIHKKQKRFKLYHKYYCSEFISTSYFKVIDIFNIDDQEYVVLLFSDNIQWLIPNIIDYYNHTYELIYDKNNIINQNIINSKESYPGFQIIYWFYQKYNKKYSEFKPYIEDNGKSKIQDNNYYFVEADFLNGKYINTKITLDRRKQNGRQEVAKDL